MMQVKFFSIPVFNDDNATIELNKFISSHKINSMDKHFIDNANNSAWSIMLTYTESMETSGSTKKRDRVDYKTLLNEADFALFLRLRDLRKQLADKEGVPVYTLFNNEQLAAMAEQRISTVKQLLSIPGIGPAKEEKYGAAFLHCISQKLTKETAPNREAT